MKNIKTFEAFTFTPESETYDWRWYATQIEEIARDLFNVSGHKAGIDDAISHGINFTEAWESFNEPDDANAFYDMTMKMPIANGIEEVIEPMAFIKDGENWFFGVTEGYDYYRYLYGIDGDPREI